LIFGDSDMDCGGTTPLSFDATCRVEPKRGHVRALQIRIPNSAGETDSFPEFILGWTIGAIGV